jgi:hypothetical protein
VGEEIGNLQELGVANNRPVGDVNGMEIVAIV